MINFLNQANVYGFRGTFILLLRLHGLFPTRDEIFWYLFRTGKSMAVALGTTLKCMQCDEGDKTLTC